MFTTKLTELKEAIKQSATAYTAKVEEDEKQFAAELAAGEAQRLAEEAVSGDSSVDTKLPYAAWPTARRLPFCSCSHICP